MTLPLRPLPPQEVDAALAGLPGWSVDGDALVATYEAPTSALAVRLLTAVAATSQDVDHHPDVDWRHTRLHLRTTTHAAGHRVTARDVDLAHRVLDLAAALGVPHVG